jgi:FixJ family two-component response regulator
MAPPVISIVDDDLSVRRALQRVVQSGGYTGETFASAGEFLDSSPLGRTACLVLDIHLGTTTGFDLEEQLAIYRAAIPIIFITARDDAPTRERARRSGAAGYLPKPFEGQALLDTIGSVTARSPGPASADSCLSDGGRDSRSTAVNVSGDVNQLTDGTVRSVDAAMRGGMALY